MFEIITLIILGVLVGICGCAAVLITIYDYKFDEKTVGYMVINLDDIDTNNLRIYWTNPKKLFNKSDNIVFQVRYVHEGIEATREKK